MREVLIPFIFRNGPVPMIQVIYSGEMRPIVNSKPEDFEANEPSPRTKMITIRLTEEERDELNRECCERQISVQNYVRAKLKLPADVEPREKRAVTEADVSRKSAVDVYKTEALLSDGSYQVQVIDSEMKPMISRYGRYLQLTLKVLGC